MAFPLYPTYQQYYQQPPMPDYRMMAQPQQMAQGQPMQGQQMNQSQQQMSQNIVQNVPMQSMTQGISVASRPVGNREEALGVPADFSGAPMIFPDAAHDTVYIKRWDMNKGAAEFAEYTRVTSSDNASVSESQKQDVTAFASVDALAALEQRIVALENRKSTAIEKPLEKHAERPTERDKSGRYVSKKKEVTRYADESDDEYDAE